MVMVNFVDARGQTTCVDASIGASLMVAALQSNVKGIEAECGGSMSCVTCHVYVEQGAAGQRPSDMTDEERELLDYTKSPRRPESRLSCQVLVSEGLDGVTVRIPEDQV
jgi:2Fe-2S ferredoxin